MRKLGNWVPVAMMGAGLMVTGGAVRAAWAQGPMTGLDPANPFYAPSSLPYGAPPFDRIKDADYQPAIEAGMVAQRREIDAIANNAEAPTFENTLVALERSGQLLNRVTLVFGAVAQANTNDALQKVQEAEAAKLAAQSDYIYLNPKLFARVQAVYDRRASLGLDPESERLLDWDYLQFVKAGAKLNDADKAKLKKLNEEESVLSTAFGTKLLAATKAAAYSTTAFAGELAVRPGCRDEQEQQGGQH